MHLSLTKSGRLWKKPFRTWEGLVSQPFDEMAFFCQTSLVSLMTRYEKTGSQSKFPHFHTVCKYFNLFLLSAQMNNL